MAYELKLSAAVVLPWALAAAIVGCGPTVDNSGDDDGPAPTSDSGVDGSASASGAGNDGSGSGSAGNDDGGPGSASGSSGDGGTPVVCEEHDNNTCGPANCDEMTGNGAWACGPLAMFDADGCLRPWCRDDESCGEGERCYRPQDWGGCVASAWSCEPDETGECICGGTADCGGAYCVAADDYPVAKCDVGPEFTCGNGVDCEQEGCGESPFDEDGCLRRACNDTNECDAGEECRAPDGGCAPSNIGCFQQGDACECWSTDDCGGRYCFAR